MIKGFNNILKFYNTLSYYNKFVIKNTLIATVTSILLAVYTNYAQTSANYYNLLLLTDDLLKTATSVASIGFIFVIINAISEKR